MERLPSSLMSEEILRKLDLETLCMVACTTRYLRDSVHAQVLPSLSSLHLRFPVDAHTLHCIARAAATPALRHLTLNCQRLHPFSIARFLAQAPKIQRLLLLSCSNLSHQFLPSIGDSCPLLTDLALELPHRDSSLLFKTNLAYMLTRCKFLESLDIKIKGIDVDANAFCSIGYFLPKTIKVLKLKPMLANHAIPLIIQIGIGFSLQCLSLVLDLISDTLLFTITKSLPLLMELHLEDRPINVPAPQLDLTNSGLQSLASCHHLTSLSLVRGRHNHQQSFKRVNDMGMFLLSESCKTLQSVRLCGFSKVSDAGFASLLHSWDQLQKFEVRNALLLSDLAFHDLAGGPCGLTELRLLSCGLITSETVNKLTSASSLQVLDLCGCKSIADSCLSSISCLRRLTTLNLTRADVTDGGMSVIGQGSTPISRLCLRGCKRVTDKGIYLLLLSGGAIGKTLSALDLGYMPGISDGGIHTIAAAGREITELSIRCCFYVTDASLQELAMKRRVEDGSKPLTHLDLFNCVGLSPSTLRLLRRPFFHGLRWLGIGKTRVASKGDAIITEIYEERPWLTVCLDGCEMGCLDGWQFHGQEHI